MQSFLFNLFLVPGTKEPSIPIWQSVSNLIRTSLFRSNYPKLKGVSDTLSILERVDLHLAMAPRRNTGANWIFKACREIISEFEATWHEGYVMKFLDLGENLHVMTARLDLQDWLGYSHFFDDSSLAPPRIEFVEQLSLVLARGLIGFEKDGTQLYQKERQSFLQDPFLGARYVGILSNLGIPVDTDPRIFCGSLMQGLNTCLLYTSPSPRDVEESRMPSSA